MKRLPVYVLLFVYSFASGQVSRSRVDFPDYQQLLREMGSRFMSGGAPGKTLSEILTAAAGLTDEGRAGVGPVLQRRTVPSAVWDASAIYTQRQRSVFIVGKLYRNDPVSGVRYDLTGTAFAIGENGVCVTNYHVLKSIIHAEVNAADSVYFIATADGEVFFVDSVLAYSKNNDLAVFRVAMRGGRLRPIPLGRKVSVGAEVFCISHPLGHFYYFSRGMVARNVTIDSVHAAAGAGFNGHGKVPLRMEITADYGIGSSGGPVLDRYGNLAGIISSTETIYFTQQDGDGRLISQPQMVVKECVPVEALRRLLL